MPADASNDTDRAGETPASNHTTSTRAQDRMLPAPAIRHQGGPNTGYTRQSAVTPSDHRRRYSFETQGSRSSGTNSDPFDQQQPLLTLARAPNASEKGLRTGVVSSIPARSSWSPPYRGHSSHDIDVGRRPGVPALAAVSMSGQKPAVRPCGPPDETLLECPQTVALNYQTICARLPDNATWYSPLEPQWAQLVACEACYEDKVRSSPFSERFVVLANSEVKHDDQVCQFGRPYLATALEHHGPAGDWQGFVSAASRRAHVAECRSKRRTYVRGRTWYRFRRRMTGLRICEACYLDRVASMPFAPEFQRLSHDELATLDEEQVICAFSVISISLAWGSAVVRNDYGIFCNAVKVIMQSHPCDAGGIKGVPWYTIEGGGSGFNVCQACYAGIICPYELGQFFILAQRDPEVRLLCDLHPTAPRFPLFVRKLAQAVNVADFSIFSLYAQRLCSIPICPRAQAKSDTPWYFLEDCAVCPECYETVVSHTALAGQIAVTYTRVRRPTLCGLYSMSMKRRWAAACTSGKIDEFVRFARHRLQVYGRTVPVMEHMLQAKSQQMKQALDYGVLSVSYDAGERHARTEGAGDGYLHGNAEVGWHHTWHGAESARLTSKMMEGILRAQRGDEWTTMAHLEEEWAEVE
ncbi:Uu.00g054630.m01.CDS01 [Anthostomella pinea]|uniref:Uu.00g054630.m01.CDS01 n=1 Tax=Anthostomella pinea TaxID=933095 RepID=A0AAI8VXW9_9PEZI|nr:Uu.00g054630.m01.CDS01 [Anthostomella pinea]